MIQTLVFELDKSQVLNSNNKLYMYLHSKIVSHLRKLSAEKGMERHSEENRPFAQEKLELLYSEANAIAKKKKLRKTLSKRKGITDEEIEALMTKAADDEEIAERLAKNVKVVPLFNIAKVTVTAAPPTRRRMDPPNLWPTAKAILDGLTDASWWSDDDFKHVVETSFRYGGLSGVKDTFKITVKIEEVTDIDSYILESEVVEEVPHE
jgi:Holliday junction resolvase RusA-like endonuclease